MKNSVLLRFMKKETIYEIEPEMVRIPRGSIELRDDRIQQVWTTKILPMDLAKHLVTQKQYEAVVHANPSAFKGTQLPVEGVSWIDAVTYCNALSDIYSLEKCYETSAANKVLLKKEANGFRLPAEAEWEYACRAGSTGIRYGTLDAIAWYKNNSEGTTQPVGQKIANDWGLYDMLGNVWEWCSDVYDETVYGSYRIIRGGGWNDNERGCMATNRRRSHPVAFKIDDLGFRVARNSTAH